VCHSGSVTYGPGRDPFPHMTALENVWNAPVRVLGQPKDKVLEVMRELTRVVSHRRFAV
jgi:ABC-type histidine transport system ATPase subunit